MGDLGAHGNRLWTGTGVSDSGADGVAVRKRRWASHGCGRQRGQSLVELAVALPLLLLLLLGTIDLGRVFFDYIQLRGAVREGAGYGARAPSDAAGIEERVREHGIPADSIVTSGCAPASSCTTIGGTATITVTATRTFRPLSVGLLEPLGLGAVPLRASASMRVMT